MYVLIISGMSGAGKSQALRKLEDMGFFCVDNLPPVLIDGLVTTLERTGTERMALCVDIRGELAGVPELIADLRRKDTPVELLFLDAPDAVLIKRYSQTRRIHPLAGSLGSIQEGIDEERRLLEPIRVRADYRIDTGALTPNQLHLELENLFSQYRGQFAVFVRSFGFKQGLPQDADLVFDVRFLPNPYWVESLRGMSGLDGPVRDYVFGFDIAHEFARSLADMIEKLLPHYEREGKRSLNVCIGCTGGRHRSVALADMLNRLLCERDIASVVAHRDIAKDIVQL